jgi:hypothetical protein
MFGDSPKIPDNCQYNSNTFLAVNPGQPLAIGFNDSQSNGFSDTVLYNNPTAYELVCPFASSSTASANPPTFSVGGAPSLVTPFFYQDAARTYFALGQTTDPKPVSDKYWAWSGPASISFSPFWHPHACTFVRTFNRYGIPSFFSLLNQQRTNDGAIISGFKLSVPSPPGLTPGLTGGVLYASGQLVQATSPAPPAVDPSPQGKNQNHVLYCTSSGSFYVLTDTAVLQNPGDALIGSIQTDGTSIVSVQPPSV